MGICLSTKSPPRRNHSKRVMNQSTTSINSNSSHRSSRFRSSSGKKEKFDDAIIREHAIAAALFFQQHQQQNGGVLPFDRSTSLRHPPGAANSKRLQGLPRSSSTRHRSVTDPLVPPQQLLNQYSRTSDLLSVHQDVNLDELETNHIVLVHGGGFGAWCWYKTIALLEECKFRVTAIDLTGSGIDLFDTNSIKSLSQYVILVGHDFGGACISYAMELFPSKIAKAIFIAASMLKTGQSTLDMFSQKENTNELMRQAQKFLYGNGNNLPPTAIDLDKMLLKDLLFNHSPAKDVALASVSMRPIPFPPVLEKLSISDSNYGSVRRFYIETPDDNAIPVTLQESMINESPPEKVFRLKGSDHSPFFSKPQALHKLLVEITKIT
ncbi:hypothetical protein Ccrd_005317 [Cynara cardunculus var. scolymus]|uniref:AB hydrolase-1 domain-containing protein n=1 Tax=Cynara cardunculus var. scolymus TaxID=59895 RepID=A0A103XKZ7_CYNCS|nr:hypothetical protein Ccrd_005317 [Cynara cardunculus var. scolymus]